MIDSMVGAPKALLLDLRRRGLEAPPGRRFAVLMKRLGKYFLAAGLFYTGFTKMLLKRLLHSGRAALILGYHGVSEGSPTLLSRGHSLENIGALLRFLGRHLRPEPVGEIAGSLARGEAPSPGFAVTFDDGLVNNVVLALPFLKQIEIPATFFVPSDLVGSRQDLWPARVREIVYMWRGPAIPAEPGLWPELRLKGDGSRYAACHRIKEALKKNETRRKDLLERLARAADRSSRPPDADRVVGHDLFRLMVQPGFSVGAHSRSHPILSGLEPSRAVEEIAGSRRDLEQMLGVEVLDFAYPNGRFADFNETTRRLVAEAGYRCAVTTEPGTVIPGDDPLALRRCMPEDVPAFLAAFDLLIRVWKDRRRPADATRPVGSRLSYLGPTSAEGAA